jgi:hypothetical protein
VRVLVPLLTGQCCDQRRNLVTLIGSGGLSPNAANLLIETNQGINSGRIKAAPRTQWNTAPTTLEEFAQTMFASAFKAAPDASLSNRFGGLLLRSYLFATGRRAA